MRRSCLRRWTLPAVGLLNGLILVLFAGCGGGGGGGGSSATSAQTLARHRMADATRATRFSLAIAGMGKRMTRSAAPEAFAGNRLPIFLLALRRGRAAGAAGAPVTGQDPDTGLYYKVIINSDGSGSQALFANAGMTQPAGSFTWGPPQWSNNQPGSYPAVITSNFSITAGQYAGSYGTLQVTVNDPSGTSDLLNLVLNDALHDQCNGQFKLLSGKLTGVETCHCQSNDDFTANCDDSYQIQCQWPDNCRGTINTDDDGAGAETYSDSSGDAVATGDYTDTGVDTIDYSDGGSDVVSTDTSDDSGGDGGDAGDGGGDSSQAVRRLRAVTRSPMSQSAPTRPANPAPTR